MIAGLLNETIEIHSPIYHKNEYGEVEDNIYKKKYQTKAQVIYNSGSRITDNNEVFNEYKLQFIVRYYHRINENDRVYFNNRFYQIEAIEKSRQYQLQKINCSLINE